MNRVSFLADLVVIATSTGVATERAFWIAQQVCGEFYGAPDNQGIYEALVARVKELAA